MHLFAQVLLQFLNKVVSFEKQNKMNLNNVAMIMAPNLFLSSEAKSMPTIHEVKHVQATVDIVRMLIKYQMILWTVSLLPQSDASWSSL